LEEEKSVNVGQAAHITAAAPGGKRYDASLTPKERRGASNGIWLCQLCAKLIDTDEARFTVDLLRKWKQDAEERAFRDIATAAPGLLGDRRSRWNLTMKTAHSSSTWPCRRKTGSTR
jgi:hypothetical protein